MIELDGKSLHIEGVFEIASRHEKIKLNSTCRQLILSNRNRLENMLENGERLYGINTGFGKFFNVDVPRDKLINLQKNLIRSHASGVGTPLSVEHVRAMMVVRANSLSKGYSGIRPIVVETLIDALNKELHPLVPSIGSVGASGDLAPLAHVALSLMGEGKFIGSHHGKSLLEKAGIEPLQLLEKEGVAFINGTSTISGILAFELQRAYRLLNAAVISASISFTALKGNNRAFRDWLVKARPHNGQVKIAGVLRNLLDNSSYEARNLQDSYSLRCIPQVYGAVLDTLEYAKRVVEIEINSVTDNPLVSDTEVVSGGNFHGEPVALVSDFLAIALTDLGNMIERRIARIVDPDLSGLPAFLTRNLGIQSGYMIPQYTAAALCNMNKVLSTPASADTIPTSANQEDHVSMGTTSALKLAKIVDNLYEIISIEFLLAGQALDLSDVVPSGTIKEIHESLRNLVPMLEEDRPPYLDIEKVRESLTEGKLGQLCDGRI